MPSAPSRILIIEDDPGLAELLTECLRLQDLSVEAVQSGRACLSWLSSNEADLLLIDYSLPDMTGAALIEELGRAKRQIPFVVITGGGHEDVAVQLMKLGALDYQVKDASLFDRLPGVVLRVLKEIANQRRMARGEAELAAIYDNAPIMLLLVGSDLKVRRINRAAAGFAGRSMDAAASILLGDLLGCVDAPQGCGFGPECSACPLRMAVLDTIATGATHRRIETHPHFIRNCKILEVTLLVSTARMAIDAENMVLLCLEDISQQKLAELRVREQAALLDVTRDAIMTLDCDDALTYWNRSAEHVYGWTAKEAVGRKIGDLFPTVDPGEGASIKSAVWEHGEWMGEIRWPNRAGNLLRIQRRANLLLKADGNPRGVLLVDTDVTDARRIEEQLLRAQRLDSLGSLAGGVAHDLNNVFTPIMMSINMLGMLAMEDQDREMIQLLSDSTHRGADIVQQLLLFSRGSDSLRTEVNLALVVRQLQRMIEGTFPKNIVLSIQTPADLWTVHGDQTQLHQVLLNLCVNARDAMPQGGRLEVVAQNIQVDAAFASRQLEARPGPHVFLRVIDTGTGVPLEIIEKIFDPFFTTKPLGQGTGLGLSTTLGIVRSHGGFITVKSLPGTGSEFGVYLPALMAASRPKNDSARRDAFRGQGELVLVADDEPNIRTMIERALRNDGYETVCVGNGSEAVDFVSSRAMAVKLLITDMMMPTMDGMLAVRAIRQMHPRLPVVAITGAQGRRGELDQLPPPQVRHLAKPFSIDALLAIAREAIDDPEANLPAKRSGEQ